MIYIYIYRGAHNFFGLELRGAPGNFTWCSRSTRGSKEPQPSTGARRKEGCRVVQTSSLIKFLTLLFVIISFSLVRHCTHSSMTKIYGIVSRTLSSHLSCSGRGCIQRPHCSHLWLQPLSPFLFRLTMHPET